MNPPTQIIPLVVDRRRVANAQATLGTLYLPDGTSELASGGSMHHLDGQQPDGDLEWTDPGGGSIGVNAPAG